MYLILALFHGKGRLIKCHDSFRCSPRFSTAEHSIQRFLLHRQLLFFLLFSTRRRKTSEWWGTEAAVAGVLPTSAHAIDPAHRTFKEPLSILSRWSTVGQLDTCLTPPTPTFCPLRIAWTSKSKPQKLSQLWNGVIVTRLNHGHACGANQQSGSPN